MGDLLDMDSVLDMNEMDSLFEGMQDEENTEEEESPSEENNNKETTEETPEGENPESVGSENDTEEQEDTTPKGSGSSPNFYSSIAKALKEDGVFPDLEDEKFNSINEAEDLKEAIELQIQAGLNERQQRIDKALNAGIEVPYIKRFESTLDFLDGINEKSLSEETEQGEKLRKDLIYQDFVNRGYSKERAMKEVQKSLNAGTDVDDAIDALQSNKEFYQGLYNKEIETAQAAEEERKKELQANVEKLKKSVLEDEKFMGDLTVEKSVRNKIYDNISKPIYRDPDSGMYLTALQKYEKENKLEFIKNIGILYTMTNGFKDINKLVGGKVKKEVNKGIKALESTLNNTARNSDGSLRFVSGVNDENSYLSGDWDLAL